MASARDPTSPRLAAELLDDAIATVMRVFPGARLVALETISIDEVPPAAVSDKQPGTAAHASPP